MRYRVGLDVGTASLGVAAVSLDANSQPMELIWKRVRIFDEPLEKSQAGHERHHQAVYPGVVQGQIEAEQQARCKNQEPNEKDRCGIGEPDPPR